MNKDIIGEFEDSLLNGIKNPNIKYSLDIAILLKILVKIRLMHWFLMLYT